jgi:hypothetical protein
MRLSGTSKWLLRFGMAFTLTFIYLPRFIKQR